MSLLREFGLGWLATFIRPFVQRNISIPQEACDTVENASSPNADFCRTTTEGIILEAKMYGLTTHILLLVV